MIPGELILDEGSHALNPGLDFDRAAAHGMRLNIASGMAVRFEPGQQRTVELVEIGGDRQIYGFRGLVQGALPANARD